MRGFVLLFLTLAASYLFGTDGNALSKLLTKHHVQGAICIAASGRVHSSGSADTIRRCPASTFKILNALIALESGIISEKKNRMQWDGKKRFYAPWNRDQSLASALKYSCVWYFQQLARRIGRKKYLYWLRRLRYGNARVGKRVDLFWLDSSLRISAREQLAFIRKFVAEKLPFRKKHIRLVKSLLRIKRSDRYSLYAKTGWAMRIRPQVGWYVGWVEGPKGKSCFALNYFIRKKEDARFRRTIAESGLKLLGLLPSVF